jgi:hypothetical protein
VNIDEQSLVCLRLSGAAYIVVAEGRGDASLAHPDWPGLTIDLAALWR